MSAPREPLPLPWWLRGSFWRWVVRVAAALVLLALTLATWVLLYPPSLGPVRQDLQELVSRKLHRKVSFDTLTWTWSNGLKVRVTGVELGSKALRVQKVRLGVKLLPLLRGEVRFQGLELVGLDLPLERRADGRLFAGGFYMDPDRNLIFPLLARFGHFRITHSTLRWRDRVPGHPVRVALRDWRVDVHRQGTAHRVEVHGSLGNGEVEARGRIRDFGQGPSGWRLDVRMAAAGLAPDTIRPYLGDRGPDRLLGRLAFRADVQGGLGAGVEVTGRAALRGGGVRWPARLRAPLEGLEARGRFRYRLDAKGQDLELRALKLQRGPLTVTGQGGLRLAKGDGGPRVDLDLRSGSVELEDLDPFYRLRALPPKLRSWLQEALAGRIVRTHMVLHGPLARFPFPDNQGRFRVEAEVQDVRLDYHHGWPPLEGLAGTLVLDGRRLAFSNGSARILRARVSGLGASVHDFAARPPRLRLHGTVDLNLLDGARFLERSGLVEPGFLDPGVLVGGGRLELGLELPLGGEEAPEVYGTLHLQRAAYRPASGWPALVDLNGGVDFQGPRIRAAGLRGRLLGQPVRLSLGKDRGGPFRAQVEGSFPAAALRAAAARMDWQSPLLRRLTGSVATRLEVTTGHGAPHFRVKANLKNAALVLPAPLFNGIGQPGMLGLEGALGGPAGFRARLLTGGDEWRARVEKDSRGALRVGLSAGFGREAPVPREGRWRLRGHMGTLALGGWMDLLRDLGGGDGGSRTLPRLEADLGVDRVRWRGHTLYTGRVQASGLPLPEGYRLRGALQGERLAGQFLWLHRSVRDRAEVRVQRMRLPPPTEWDLEGGSGGGGDWRVPPLDLVVRADRIRVGDQELRDSHLQARFYHGHWLLPELQTRIGPSKLKMRGNWNGARTRARVDLATQDLGRWLRDLGVYPSMKGGRGSAHAVLTWPGQPGDFEAGRLNGGLRLAVRDGRFKEFYFLSKALATLNVLDWPKQVLRGFSDLGHSGLVYRNLRGKAAIDNGQLGIRKLVMNSAPLRLRADGGLDLRARTYDLTLRLQPLQTLDQLISAVPLVGYLLTGDEKVLASLEYRVEGPWSKPRVAAVNPSDRPSFLETLGRRIEKMRWEDLAPWR